MYLAAVAFADDVTPAVCSLEKALLPYKKIAGMFLRANSKMHENMPNVDACQLTCSMGAYLWLARSDSQGLCLRSKVLVVQLQCREQRVPHHAGCSGV